MTDMPIDGFTITRQGDYVLFTLSNRYGFVVCYQIDLADAHRIGELFLEATRDG